MRARRYSLVLHAKQAGRSPSQFLPTRPPPLLLDIHNPLLNTEREWPVACKIPVLIVAVGHAGP